jgi:hypothetical protein
MFYPAQGRPATGAIEPDGSYRLTTHAPGDGAVPGDYVVTVEAVQVIEAAPPPKSLSEEIAGGAAAEKARRSQVRWLAPEKYADRSTTPLKATVLDQENRLDFALP